MRHDRPASLTADVCRCIASTMGSEGSEGCSSGSDLLQAVTVVSVTHLWVCAL